MTEKMTALQHCERLEANGFALYLEKGEDGCLHVWVANAKTGQHAGLDIPLAQQNECPGGPDALFAASISILSEIVFGELDPPEPASKALH